jgi:hypothetical protein
MEDNFDWLEFDEFTFHDLDHDIQVKKCISYDPQCLRDVVNRIGKEEGNDMVEDFQERTELIILNMGSLRLCQLDRGELLRELGAIKSLLDSLSDTRHWCILHTEVIQKRDELTTAAIKLSIACWQALRELACGSIGNRTAIRKYRKKEVSGIQLMVYYLEIFEMVSWEVMDTLQLQLVTAVIGVMRNVSHKTYENCKQLHECGATTLLVTKLLQGAQKGNLPGQESPWREGCFRAGGTLINLSEEYEPCLQYCSTNSLLVSILYGSWGTNQRLASVFKELNRLTRTNNPQR